MSKPRPGLQPYIPPARRREDESSQGGPQARGASGASGANGLAHKQSTLTAANAPVPSRQQHRSNANVQSFPVGRQDHPAAAISGTGTGTGSAFPTAATAKLPTGTCASVTEEEVTKNSAAASVEGGIVSNGQQPGGRGYQPYIPPARRRLIEESNASTVKSTIHDQKPVIATAIATGTELAQPGQLPPPPPVLSNSAASVVTAPAPPPPSMIHNVIEEYTDISNCCLFAEGFHPELHDYSKSLMLKPFTDRGALSRWVSSTEVILVFHSAQQTQAALAAPRNSLMRVSLLANYADKQKAESLCRAGRELQADLKPERDTRVASRMIGAALGIRIPRKAPSGDPAVGVASKRPTVAAPAVDYDSWDEA